MPPGVHRRRGGRGGGWIGQLCLLSPLASAAALGTTVTAAGADAAGPLTHCLATLPAHGVSLPPAQAVALCAALLPSPERRPSPQRRRRIVIDGIDPATSPSAFDHEGEMDQAFATFSGAERGRDIMNLLLTALCVLCAALASGLTIGLMSIDPLELEVKARAGAPWEKQAAARILPLVTRHHLLLVSLLLLNAAAAEALPIFLDALVPSWCAILVSVTLVLVVGEILPTSVFSGPKQLRLAAQMTPVVWAIVGLFSPIAYPIARLLDCCFGGHGDDEEEGGRGHGKRFTPAELAVLLEIHHQEAEALLKLSSSSSNSNKATDGPTTTTTSITIVPDHDGTSPPHRGSSAAELLGALAAQATALVRRPTATNVDGGGYLLLEGEEEGNGVDGSLVRPRAAPGASLLTSRRLAAASNTAGGHNSALRRQLSASHYYYHQQQLTGSGTAPPSSSSLSLEEGGGEEERGAVSEAALALTDQDHGNEDDNQPPLILPPSSPTSDALMLPATTPSPSLTPPSRSITPRLPLAATPLDALRAYLPLSPGRTPRTPSPDGGGFATRLLQTLGASPREDTKEGATVLDGEGAVLASMSLRGQAGAKGEEEGFDVEM